MPVDFKNKKVYTSLWRMLLFIACHTSANVLASRYFSESGLGTIFWPASGIAIAVILMGGLKYLPALLVACVVGGFINGRAWEVRIIFILINCFEAALAWFLIVRVLRLSTSLDTARDYLKFLAIAGVVLPIPSALIAAATITSFSPTKLAFSYHFISWWMGNSLGIILLTPIILIWQKLPGGWFDRSRIIEACLGILLTIASGVFFLSGVSEFAGAYPRAFIAFIFISWAATRFGRHATLLIIAIIFLQTLFTSLAANGQLGRPVEFANIWLFLVTLSTVGMALATAFNERRTALNKLNESLAAYRREEERRREADFALRKTSIDFQRLVETAEEGVWTVDNEGMTTFTNERMAALLGYEPRQMQGKPVTDFIKPELRAASDAILSRRKSGQREMYEFPLQHRDGKEIWVQVSSNPITDIEGNMTGALAMITDITTRKKTDLALRESEDRYRKIIEAASDSIIAHQSGFIVFANPAAIRMMKAKSEADLIGRNALDFVHPDDKAMVIERMKKVIQPGARVPIAQERFIRLDGKVMNVEVAATNISWDGRSATMVIARELD